MPLSDIGGSLELSENDAASRPHDAGGRAAPQVLFPPIISLSNGRFELVSLFITISRNASPPELLADEDFCNRVQGTDLTIDLEGAALWQGVRQAHVELVDAGHAGCETRE